MGSSSRWRLLAGMMARPRATCAADGARAAKGGCGARGLLRSPPSPPCRRRLTPGGPAPAAAARLHLTAGRDGSPPAILGQLPASRPHLAAHELRVHPFARRSKRHLLRHHPRPRVVHLLSASGPRKEGVWQRCAAGPWRPARKPGRPAGGPPPERQAQERRCAARLHVRSWLPTCPATRLRAHGVAARLPLGHPARPQLGQALAGVHALHRTRGRAQGASGPAGTSCQWSMVERLALPPGPSLPPGPAAATRVLQAAIPRERSMRGTRLRAARVVQVEQAAPAVQVHAAEGHLRGGRAGATRVGGGARARAALPCSLPASPAPHALYRHEPACALRVPAPLLPGPLRPSIRARAPAAPRPRAAQAGRPFPSRGSSPQRWAAGGS